MASARVLVLLSALCFGTTGTAQALGPHASPAAVGAARVLVGGFLLVLVARRSAPPLAARCSGRAVLIGAAAVGGYQLTFFAGIHETGVAVGTVVAIGSGPVFAGLLGRVIHREPVAARWWAATALSVAGVILLVAAGSAAHVRAGGVVLALAAGLCYATYTVAAKGMLAAGHAPEAVMARIFGIGALGLFPVLIFNGPGALASAGGVALAIYLGAVPTALAYVLFARGLRHLPAGEVATLTLAEPLTAAALGAAILGERPGVLALGGVALVLAGLAALAAPGRVRSRPVLVPS
ncbi:MAG TPA: EamA family transporter [Solirubrobacteraceae bacterium]|nr:EamA family transporter [Solirubrobacteraceae bacterium]